MNAAIVGNQDRAAGIKRIGVFAPRQPTRNSITLGAVTGRAQDLRFCRYKRPIAKYAVPEWQLDVCPTDTPIDAAHMRRDVLEHGSIAQSIETRTKLEQPIEGRVFDCAVARSADHAAQMTIGNLHRHDARTLDENACARTVDIGEEKLAHQFVD